MSLQATPPARPHCALCGREMLPSEKTIARAGDCTVHVRCEATAVVMDEQLGIERHEIKGFLEAAGLTLEQVAEKLEIAC